MKNILLIAALLVFAAGCRSESPEKPTLARGWMGGEYGSADKHVVPKGQQSRVYVKQIYPGTPAEGAGLKPGDLILRLDGQPVEKLSDFRKSVDSIAPGKATTVQVLRSGQSLDLPLTMGRETFQEWHAIWVGARWSTDLDLWPNPDFTLFGVIDYQRQKDRMELRSAENALAGWKPPGNPDGLSSGEGWRSSFVIFGFNGYKQILAQQTVAADSHTDSEK